jgi:uncharacterized protein YbjT (DUF2867 family)
LEITRYKKTALLFGATGLIGRHCLQQLLEHPAYQKVVTFTRRPLDIEHPHLEQHLIDFKRLEEYADLIRGHDLFSCLGTTMAKAGSKQAFYEVDFTYAQVSARIACENGAGQLLLVSSVGADRNALFFYSRVKGALEDAVKQLPYWGTHIFQPSILLGQRHEMRPAERLAAGFSSRLDRLTGGSLFGKYRPVEGQAVARAMLAAAQQLKPGLSVYPSDEIHRIAASTF